MKRTFALLLALCILLSAGCAAQNTPTTKPTTPAATSSQTPMPTPESPEGTALKYPLKENDAIALMEEIFEGQPFEVKAVTRYVNDFLIEMGEPAPSPVSLLYYVFGETGRTVQLTGTSVFTSYRVSGAGQVEYTLSGAEAEVPFKGMPKSGRVTVFGDAEGYLGDAYRPVHQEEQEDWLETTEPVYIGSWNTAANERGDSNRHHQLYDARIDVNGLSFAFIPSGNSYEEFHSFFPAVTTCPDTDVFMDGDVFTVRLYNTCLESGGISMDDPEYNSDWYAHYPDYPYSFPEGSLGEDSHFLTDAEIHQDGSNVVITCRLTEHAQKYQVARSNFGGDTIPYLTVTFCH